MSEYFARALSNDNVCIVAFLPYTPPRCPLPSQCHKSCHSYKPLYISRRYWRPMTLLVRFKAMLRLETFLHFDHFVSRSLVAFLSKGFGGAFAKNGHPRLLSQRQIGHPNCHEILPFCIRAQTDYKNLLSTFNVMNFTNCIPTSRLYCCMIPDSH